MKNTKTVILILFLLLNTVIKTDCLDGMLKNELIRTDSDDTVINGKRDRLTRSYIILNFLF